MFLGVSHAELGTDADYKPDFVSPWKTEMDLF
jgi:hypothetical protein